MWIVAKIKVKEINLFKKTLASSLDKHADFYLPKILYTKIKKNKKFQSEKYILGSYIFCKSEKFKDTNILNQVKFIKGLDYFLDSSICNQEEINKFIKFCKTHEDTNNYLSSSFFKSLLNIRAKFASGPLKNFIFNIVKKENNKLRAILNNNMSLTIDDKKIIVFTPHNFLRL